MSSNPGETQRLQGTRGRNQTTAARHAMAVGLDATRRPFAEARTLPSASYTSDDIFRLEQSELFGKMWLCVGRTADVPRPGDFFTHPIADELILVVRGKDNVVRGFMNVCRHRGSRIVTEARGQGLEWLRCPYHAWTYQLDGRLSNAPRMAENFCKDDFPLAPLQLGILHGFIFINLNTAAEPLESAMAELPDLSRYRMGELACGKRVEYEVQANWKFICENYSECYHCAGVHPQLFRISEYLSRGVRKTESGSCFNGGPMQLREGFDTMSMSGRSVMPRIPGLSANDHRLVYYYVIYPNLLLSPHPDYVLTHTVWPLTPTRTRIVCEWLFTEEAVSSKDFDPGDIVEFWDVTNRQDWVLCERAQLGAQSRGYRPGPYQPSEDCVHLFDRWYGDRIAPLL